MVRVIALSDEVPPRSRCADLPREGYRGQIAKRDAAKRVETMGLNEIDRGRAAGVASMTDLTFHELSEIFPMMRRPEFEGLLADIRAHGLREPIILYEGKILDGRNRFRACQEAGVDVTYELYAGNDPLAYVVSQNLHRRHLDESQRAMVAARVATLGNGQHPGASIEAASQSQAAEMLNVSRSSVQRAREVVEHGSPELIQAVEGGEVSVSVGADIATQPEDVQREIVAHGEKEILKAAQEIRAKKAQARRADRVEKLVELSNANAPLVADRRYPVVYADPPWQYDHMISVSREIENQYPTMDIDAICALPVADLCTPDAMLFLWVPPSLLRNGVRVLEAWGFNFLTSFVWDKQSIGMGYYVRQQHEHVLLGSRGTAIVPDPSTLSSSVLSAPRGAHSAKPIEFYGIIERMYPVLAKIELFARSARDGWSAWGNQAQPAAALLAAPSGTPDPGTGPWRR